MEVEEEKEEEEEEEKEEVEEGGSMGMGRGCMEVCESKRIVPSFLPVV